MTFRNNFVHHNVRDGIWYDFNLNAGALIEDNRVEDNGGNGIIFETSIGATITNNTLRRNGEDAVLISVSQKAQIYNNLLEANFGGIEYFLNCGALSPRGTISGTMRRTTTRSSSARRATRSRAASATSPSAPQQSWRRI